MSHALAMAGGAILLALVLSPTIIVYRVFETGKVKTWMGVVWFAVITMLFMASPKSTSMLNFAEFFAVRSVYYIIVGMIWFVVLKVGAAMVRRAGELAKKPVN